MLCVCVHGTDFAYQNAMIDVVHLFVHTSKLHLPLATRSAIPIKIESWLLIYQTHRILIAVLYCSSSRSSSANNSSSSTGSCCGFYFFIFIFKWCASVSEMQRMLVYTIFAVFVIFARHLSLFLFHCCNFPSFFFLSREIICKLCVWAESFLLLFFPFLCILERKKLAAMRRSFRTRSTYEIKI